MGKKRKLEDKEIIVWARLSGVPCLWPVEVTKYDVNTVQVFCNCDLALLQVKRENIQKFDAKSFEEVKACGLRKLQNKPKTKQAFIDDLEWAASKASYGQTNKFGKKSSKTYNNPMNGNIEDLTGTNNIDEKETNIYLTEKQSNASKDLSVLETPLYGNIEDLTEAINSIDEKETNIFSTEKQSNASKDLSVLESPLYGNIEDLTETINSIDEKETNIYTTEKQSNASKDLSVLESPLYGNIEDLTETINSIDEKETNFFSTEKQSNASKDLSVLESPLYGNIEDLTETINSIDEKETNIFTTEKQSNASKDLSVLESPLYENIEDLTETINSIDEKETNIFSTEKQSNASKDLSVLESPLYGNIEDLTETINSIDEEETNIYTVEKQNSASENSSVLQSPLIGNIEDQEPSCSSGKSPFFWTHSSEFEDEYVSNSDSNDDSVIDPDFDFEQFLGSENEEDIIREENVHNIVVNELSTHNDNEANIVHGMRKGNKAISDAVDEVLNMGHTEFAMDETEIQDESTNPMERFPLLSKNECLYDQKYPGVYIKAFKKDNDKSKHKRQYDTVSACYYCNKLMTNIQIHLEKRHKGEKEIQQIQQMKKEINEYQERLIFDPALEMVVKNMKKKLRIEQEMIRNRGNDKHNVKVVKKQKGELILCRRGSVFEVDKYGSCPDCFEWINVRENYLKHKAHCIQNSHHTQKFALIHSLIIQGKVALQASKLLKEEVIPSMKKDEISEIAMSDELITALGDVWLIKNFSNKLKRKNYASFHMRLAARLVKLLRKKTGLMTNRMYDFLNPSYEDLLVECSLDACGLNTDEELENPSVAVKLGYDIGRLTAAKFTFSVKTKNELGRRESKDLLKMLEIGWKTKVNKRARDLLAERQFNKKNELPIPEDIAKLTVHITDQIKKLDLSMSSQEIFRRVAELAGARLILYNKRRPGELSQMMIQVYKDRQKVSETDISMRRNLSTLDLELLKHQDLIFIRGKQHRGVPVIVPREVKDLLGYLTDPNVRLMSGIKSENKYVFANTGFGPVLAAVSLDSIKTEIDLQCPERITATNLRKHTATISQVMGLNEHELRWLCNHLGHTVKVHEQHYRQTSGMIERLEIAKLMLIQEKNLVSRFAGKSLSEIDFRDLDEVDVGKNDKEADTLRSLEDLEDDDGSSSDECFPESSSAMKESASFLMEDSGFDHVKKRKGGKESTRQRWTRKEEEELKKLFKYNFTNLNCPNKLQIEEAIKKSKIEKGEIFKRKADNIKKKMSNMIIKIKKQE